MYFGRTMSEAIKKASSGFPCVLVTGPRQVGKTTLLEHCSSENRTYISLDDLQIRSLAKLDPELFFQRFQPPLLIDEIQYAPELFTYIKIIVDKQKQNGLFWLTGSQQFHLMKNVSESLAGRVAILDLQGLSQSEKLKKTKIKPFLPSNNFTSNKNLYLKNIFSLILKGSFPALYASKNIDLELFYSSYLKTYIERDVRNLLKVLNEQKFLTFIKILASRTGQLLNHADISRDVEVSLNTIKSWISILQRSGLIYLLEPYHNNLTKRALKTPKLYFLDTGLCCYLTGWKSIQTLETGAMSGAMLETYVVSEILKSYWHNAKQPELYFYRDKEKKEIDIIIKYNGKLYPIEIKKTAAPNRNIIRNFSVLDKLKKPIGKGGIICFSPNYLPISKNIDIIPISYL